jgi:hypothetical protein
MKKTILILVTLALLIGCITTPQVQIEPGILIESLRVGHTEVPESQLSRMTGVPKDIIWTPKIEKERTTVYFLGVVNCPRGTPISLRFEYKGQHYVTIRSQATSNFVGTALPFWLTADKNEGRRHFVGEWKAILTVGDKSDSIRFWIIE